MPDAIDKVKTRPQCEFYLKVGKWFLNNQKSITNAGARLKKNHKDFRNGIRDEM